LNKFLLTVVTVFVASHSYAAGFDCAKASTHIEKTICSSRKLSMLDSSLSQIYSKIVNAPLCNDYQIPYIKDDQNKWLKEVRNKCLDAPCLTRVYTERISEINNAIAQPLKLSNAKGKLTGTYHTQCFGAFGLGGGRLRLKELPNGQTEFALDCNRGSPSFNSGELQDVVRLKPKGIAKFVAAKEQGYDDTCEMLFDLSKDEKIRIDQNGDCGFGYAVECSGDYHLIDRKLPDMPQ